jgi:hypothetical protein
MASEPDSPLRFVSASQSGRPVLTGSGGRLRGEVLLQAEGPEPVALDAAEVRADIGTAATALRIESSEPLAAAPGVPRRASLTVSVDPLTPPGAYDAEIDVGGVTHPVTLVVNEDIALTLSESEVVVIAGEERVKSITMRNVGNLPLAVSQIGPAELEVDRARPTLLQRLGLLPFDAPVGPGAPRRAHDARAVDRERDAGEEDGEEGEREVPTVTARLKTPVLVAPGETVVGDWTVTVEGPLDPGVRYRGVAPLYTTDIGFVVTPAQEAPPAPRARSRRPPRKRKESS